MHILMDINYFLFLLVIRKQDQDNSSCSRSLLSLPGRGHVLVRCSHTVTGLQNSIPVLEIPGSFMEFPGSLHPLPHLVKTETNLGATLLLLIYAEKFLSRKP